MGWGGRLTILSRCGRAARSRKPCPGRSRRARSLARNQLGRPRVRQTVCTIEITRMSEDVENVRAAARTATEHKGKREEICQYLTGMAQAATKLMHYALRQQRRLRAQPRRDDADQGMAASGQSGPAGRSASWSDRRPARRRAPAQFATPVGSPIRTAAIGQPRYRRNSKLLVSTVKVTRRIAGGKTPSEFNAMGWGRFLPVGVVLWASAAAAQAPWPAQQATASVRGRGSNSRRVRPPLLAAVRARLPGRHSNSSHRVRLPGRRSNSSRRPKPPGHRRSRPEAPPGPHQAAAATPWPSDDGAGHGRTARYGRTAWHDVAHGTWPGAAMRGRR